MGELTVSVNTSPPKSNCNIRRTFTPRREVRASAIYCQCYGQVQYYVPIEAVHVWPLRVEDDFWDLAVLHGRAVVVTRGVAEGEAGFGAGAGRLVRDLPHAFSAVVWVWTLREERERRYGYGQIHYGKFNRII